MSSSKEISLACADANYDKICAMVSVKVATVDLSAAVAVARLAPTLGRVIMSQVHFRWKYAIRMTNIYS